MSSNLKLGSNWKSCGIGTDMRRWAHGNPRINFGFCKGDDNFGGRQRKEIDDFTKSLGKQMTLVMYRMQDTENVRMRLREDSRRLVREKFEKEEAEEKAKEERQERNRKWRERKEGREIMEDDEKELDEKEKRKLKNKEWRQRRESPEGSLVEEVGRLEEEMLRPVLLAGLMMELTCVGCQQEMGGGGGEVWQCREGHNICSDCSDLSLCPLCSQPVLGLNSALMAVAQILGGGKYKESELTISSSMDFTLRAPDDEEDSLDFTEPALDSLVEMKKMEDF